MEVEILKEALDLARLKKPTLLSRSQAPEDNVGEQGILFWISVAMLLSMQINDLRRDVRQII